MTNLVKTAVAALVIAAGISTAAAAEQRVLSGTVSIDEPIVLENTDLVISPGTRVVLRNSLGYGVHVKNGTVTADGTADRPIVIEGAGATPDDPDEANLLFLEESRGLFRNVIFRNSSWALHVHKSMVTTENCLFERNYGGMRFFAGDMRIAKTLFTGNGIAMRFIGSSPVIVGSVFAGNRTALFLREGIERAVIEGNIFARNEWDFYVGFFQTADIKAAGNYFLDAPAVFDKSRDGEIGAAVLTGPELTTPPDWH